jgi:hypothetical protein
MVRSSLGLAEGICAKAVQQLWRGEKQLMSLPHYAVLLLNARVQEDQCQLQLEFGHVKKSPQNGTMELCECLGARCIIQLYGHGW